MVANVFFSLLSFASSIIIAFFLSPYILHRLGDMRYGIWALFGEMLSYYGLLDFGVRGAVNYFVGKSLANEQEQNVKCYVSSAFFGLLSISSFAFITTIVTVLFIDPTFGRGNVSQMEVISAAVLFLTIFCIGMPMELFAAVLIGSRRQFLVSTSEIVARLVSSLLMYLFLLWYPGLMGLVVAQLAGKLIYWSSLLRNSRRYVPEAKISLRAASWKSLWHLASYGLQNATITISGMLIARKDVTFITLFLGARWVANYSFARLIVRTITSACSSITQALRPNLVHHWARQEYNQVFSIYYAGVRYSSFILTMSSAFLFAYGREFMSLWIGARFTEGPWQFRTDIVLYLLLASQIPRTMHSMSWQFLFAVAKQKSFAIMIACESVINVILAVVLIQKYDVAGIAIATTIPMFLSHTVLVPWLMRRLVGVSIRRYILEGIGRPVILGVGMWIFGLWLKRVILPVAWKPLLLDAAIIGAVGTALAFIFVMRPGDRPRLYGAIWSAWKYLRGERELASSGTGIPG
ncbi:MAG: polysaccharide biosynthesis C-terminal domain-containing protein [Bryobacterales bacterium]|nr:polysaccharide biosynthesis C-terminal domain-containing protein [Bryobacterales bacterium]